MLKIYSFSLSILSQLNPLIDEVMRKDKDLARQMRRAASSVALNIAEGMYSQGGNEKARYFNAMGSANEVRSCLNVAMAWNYLNSNRLASVEDGLDRIVATLYKLTH